MTGPPTDASGLAARVDHSILTPEATRDDVVVGAASAVGWGCATVCVHPSMVGVVLKVIVESILAEL